MRQQCVRCLIVSVFLNMISTHVFPIEIVKHEIIDQQNPNYQALLKKFQYSYGIYISIASNEELLDTETGEAIQPINFVVKPKDKPDVIIPLKAYEKFTPVRDDDGNIIQDPKRADYLLLGPFNPADNYILTIQRLEEYQAIEIQASPESKKQLTSEENVSSWIANDLGIDFSFRPIINQINVFSADFNLKSNLFKLFSLSPIHSEVEPQLELEGTVASDDLVKNGFTLDLNMFNGSALWPTVNFGNTLGKYKYLLKWDIGVNCEATQKWDLARYYIKSGIIWELPLTNLPSLKVHQANQLLRASPGLMFSVSYLRNMEQGENSSFASINRADLGIDYNLTLNPMIFAKIKNRWFCDFDTQEWKNYQEYTVALRTFQSGDSYYFVKLIKGVNPPDFSTEIDEISTGITTVF